uniref:Putative La1-like peptide n=1 Tax=Superstitionia donensis TaxID=311983 RepID=A0A1V1WBF4_9SCOR
MDRNIILFFVLPFVVLGNDDLRFITYKNDVVFPLTEGKCNAGSGRLINQGDTWYSDEYCEKFKCLRTGILGHVEVRGCAPVYPIRPNCTVVHHKGVYPDCCDGDIVCNEQQEPKSDVEMAELIRALLEESNKK